MGLGYLGSVVHHPVLSVKQNPWPDLSPQFCGPEGSCAGLAVCAGGGGQPAEFLQLRRPRDLRDRDVLRYGVLQPLQVLHLQRRNLLGPSANLTMQDWPHTKRLKIFTHQKRRWVWVLKPWEVIGVCQPPWPPAFARIAIATTSHFTTSAVSVCVGPLFATPFLKARGSLFLRREATALPSHLLLLPTLSIAAGNPSD